MGLRNACPAEISTRSSIFSAAEAFIISSQLAVVRSHWRYRKATKYRSLEYVTLRRMELLMSKFKLRSVIRRASNRRLPAPLGPMPHFSSGKSFTEGVRRDETHKRWSHDALNSLLQVFLHKVVVICRKQNTPIPIGPSMFFVENMGAIATLLHKIVPIRFCERLKQTLHVTSPSPPLEWNELRPAT